MPLLLLIFGMMLLAISIAGWVHPVYRKYAEPGRSPRWLAWDGWGLRVGHVSYADPTRGDVSFEFDALPLRIIFTFFPGIWFCVPIWKRWQRNRAIRRNDAAPTCRACGYDLRASRERCPECGTPTRISTEVRG